MLYFNTNVGATLERGMNRIREITRRRPGLSRAVPVRAIQQPSLMLFSRCLGRAALGLGKKAMPIRIRMTGWIAAAVLLAGGAQAETLSL